MTRGFGAIYKTNKCNCENPQWELVSKRTIRKGKQLGKIVYMIYCQNCKSQWETSVKYAEKLDNKRKDGLM